jgi:hypothetical protein
VGDHSSNGQWVYLLKTDQDGDSLWAQGYGNEDYLNHGWGVQRTTDNGFIVSGYSHNWFTHDSDIFLLKTDEDGNEKWSQYFGGSTDDIGKKVTQTADGGYVVVGETDLYSADDYDIYLVKFTPDNLPAGISIELQYTAGSPVPPTGGDVFYGLCIRNFGSEPYDFDCWLEVAQYDCPPTTIAQRSYSNFQPGWSILRTDMYFSVPASYPPGDYQLTGKIGGYPLFVWDRCSFTFEKLVGSNDSEFDPFLVDNVATSFVSMIPAEPVSTPMESIKSHVLPNPFNPTTVISYQLSVVGKVNLSVYDILGKKVAELINGRQNAGVHEVTFDATGLASGVYIYRLQAGKYTTSGKMLLLK